MPGILGAAEASGTLPPVLIEIIGSANQFRQTVAGVMADLKTLEASGQRTSGSLAGTLGKAFAATIGSALLSLGVEAVHAADQLDVARARFASMAQSMGIPFASIQKQVDATDAAMAKLGFTNAESETALAKLTQMTGSYSEALKNMPAVANFARGAQISLNEAASMYGRIMAGFGSGGRSYLLTQYIGDVKTATGQAMSSQTILARLNTLMKAEGDAYGSTFPGKVAILKAEFIDFESNLGQKLIPVIEEVASVFGSLFDFLGKHKTELEFAAGAAGAIIAPRVAMGAVGVAKKGLSEVGRGLQWFGRTPGVVAGEKATTAEEVGVFGPAGSLTKLTMAADAASVALTHLAERSAMGGLGGGGLPGKLPTVAREAEQLPLFGEDAATIATGAGSRTGQLSLLGLGEEGAAGVGGAGLLARLGKGAGSYGKGVLGRVGSLGKATRLLKAAPVRLAAAGAVEEGGLGALLGGGEGALALSGVGLPVAAAAALVGGAFLRSSSAKHSAQRDADAQTAKYMKSISGQDRGQQAVDLAGREQMLKAQLAQNTGKGGFLGGLFGGTESFLGVGGGQDRNKIKDQLKDVQQGILATTNTPSLSPQLQPLRDLISGLKQFPQSAGAVRAATDALNASIDSMGNVDQQALQHINDMTDAVLKLSSDENALVTSQQAITSAQLAAEAAQVSYSQEGIQQMHAYTDAVFAQNDAQHGLINAAYDEAKAARDMAKANEEASIQISEAHNAITNAQIGESRSVLTLYDAQRNLYALMGSGSATMEQIQSAHLDLQSAQVGVSQSADQMAQSQIDAKYLMSANGQTTQAAADAAHSYQQSIYQSADAQHALNDAVYATNLASPAFIGNIIKEKQSYQDWQVAAQNVTTQIIAAATTQQSYATALQKTEDLLNQYPQDIAPLLDVIQGIINSDPGAAAILAPLLATLQGIEASATQAGQSDKGLIAAGGGGSGGGGGSTASSSTMPYNATGIPNPTTSPTSLVPPTIVYSGLLTGQQPPAAHRAAGGPVYPGQRYMVGEWGPEMFQPGVAGSISPNGGGHTVIVNVTQTNPTPEQIATAVGRVLQG